MQVEGVVPQRVDKQLRLRRLILRPRRFLAIVFGEADPPSHTRDARLSAGTSGSEAAVLRRSVPNERGEFHLARDQV